MLQINEAMSKCCIYIPVSIYKYWLDMDVNKGTKVKNWY